MGLDFGKSSGPAIPDPSVQAAQNAETARLQANLNRVNTTTPYGTVAWTNNGDRWTQNISLDPAQQQMLNAQTSIGNTALTAAQGRVAQGAANMGQAFDMSGLPSMVSGIDTGQLPDLVSQVSTGPVYNSFADAGPLARQIDTAGLQQIPGLNDFSAERQRVEDALYSRATSRLDPRFQQAQTDLETQLANQGIARGSEAYTKAMDDFSRQRTDAYSSAMNDAILAGGQEQSRLFGQGLSARQQGFGEGLANTSLWNQSQQQAYEQAQGRAGFANAAQQQLFGQGLTNANLTNAARSQFFNEGLSNAALQNTARQNMLNERSWLRNLPLQEAQMLMGMGQVRGPEYQGAAPVGVQPTDVQGPALAQWNAANQANMNATSNLFGLAGALGAAQIYKSDENAKEGVEDIDDDALLNALMGMDVKRWRYKPDAEPGDRMPHIGPMAQDFRRVTGLGDGRSIHMADMSGLLMGAVQALAKKVDALEAA